MIDQILNCSQMDELHVFDNLVNDQTTRTSNIDPYLKGQYNLRNWDADA